VTAALSRPTGLPPIGAPTAELMVRKVVPQVCLTQLLICPALPHLADGRAVVVGDHRAVDPVLRAKRQVAAWVQQNTLPRIEAGIATLTGLRSLHACGDRRDTAGGRVQAPDDDVVDALVLPVCLERLRLAGVERLFDEAHDDARAGVGASLEFQEPQHV